MNVMSERQERARDLRGAVRRRDLPHVVMAAIGGRWCGNGTTPMGGSRSLWVHQKVDHDDVRVMSLIDDGGWVGIGTPNRWDTTSIRPATARRMAAWILWQWAADWFGLRSNLYYRALHAAVGRDGKWKSGGTPDRKHSRVIWRRRDRDAVIAAGRAERRRIEERKRQTEPTPEPT